jgi:hypothetical protein
VIQGWDPEKIENRYAWNPPPRGLPLDCAKPDFPR